MPFRRLAVAFLAVLVAAVAAIALTLSRATTPDAPAAPPPDPAALAAPLPVDPGVRTGRLDNGLTYYIRRNTHPLGRADLRLVVDAGSILESDDQRGIAHFVEHMAFNGTTHFPGQAIPEFLRSVGMRFGPSVNASTGFDETTYSLQIPTDRADVVARALQIFEDWAQHVAFDPDEVARERGVILEEWRQRTGAAQRLGDARTALLFAGSPYADRAPIGTIESLQTMTAERLRRFYDDWYRPDLMAVVAVGDFDPAEMEQRIRKQFASLSARAEPRPRPDIDLPAPAGPAFGVYPDEGTAGAALAVYTRQTPLPQATAGDYRALLVARLTTGLASARLGELAHQPGSPVLNAGASLGRLVRAQDVVTFRAALRPEAIQPGASALLLELERIARFGFTEEELDRLKTTTLRGYERAMTQAETRASASLAAEYIRNFTIDEPFPGLAHEFELAKQFVPGITLEEINALAKSWLPAEQRVVVLSGPQKADVRLPDEAWLARVTAAAADARLTAYRPRESGRPLMDDEPEPGAIVETTMREAIGVTEWTLSNGARVILMPTEFKEDEVAFTAISPGGTSLAPDEDFVPAQTAAQVVASLGVGRFASADLRRALTGKVVNVRPAISTFEESLTGGASARDLESLFQLVYLYFTAPRHDVGLFGALTSQMRSTVAAQTSTPDFAFASALTSALTQDHPRARPITTATVDAMDLDRSIDFYRERFADAGDFTFIFAGSFEVDEMRPLVERYLASLPALAQTESWRDPGIRAPAGVVERRVARGAEPKSRTAIVFAGAHAPEPSRGLALRAAGEVLQTRLLSVLREELGGTYTVSVGANVTRIPADEYRVTVMFGSDPARADALAARVFEEVARLTAAGPTAGEVANVKTAMARDLETRSRQNAFLLSQLADSYRTGDPPEALLETPRLIASLDAAAVHAAARAALDVTRYVRVTLGPEPQR